MSTVLRGRGQPLAALALVLVTWTAARAVSWQQVMLPAPSRSEAAAPLPPVPGLARAVNAARPVPASTPAAAASPIATPASGFVLVSAADLARLIALASRRVGWSGPEPASGEDAHARDGGWFAYSLPQSDGAAASGERGAMRSPGGSAAPLGAEPAAAAAPPRRWTADAWALLRQGGAGPLAGGAVPASYGASQAGAVLRYHAAPGSAYDPAAYLRLSAALDPVGTSGAAGDMEAALGAQARPVTSVPVVLAGELRATRSAGRTRLRPAAYVVTRLAPMTLPMGLRAEAYAQAGYVAGTGATAFADGQLRVDHALPYAGRGRLRIGAGVWGGAQQGASRLDIGPGATLALPLNKRIAARVAVDYRLRVAGDAVPPSGPAITVAAGF